MAWWYFCEVDQMFTAQMTKRNNIRDRQSKVSWAVLYSTPVPEDRGKCLARAVVAAGDPANYGDIKVQLGHRGAPFGGRAGS